MATPEVAQNYVESVHHSDIDVKVATTLELPVDDEPQQVTGILSPDLVISESSPPARQLGHENVTFGPRMTPTPVVAPSSKPGTNLMATTEASLSTTHDDSLASTEQNSLLSTPKSSLPSSPEVGSPESYPALTSDNESILCEKPVGDLALRILDIIERYGHSTGAGTGANWAGKINFLPVVELCIQRNKPVKMVLPAFPCVSVFDSYPF